MELETNTLFSDLCRLCLEEPGTESIHEHTQLRRDIFQCTGIKVSISDSLPGKICTRCCNIIKMALDFREIVTKNDTLLKTLFSEVKDESEDENILNSNAIQNTNLTKDGQNKDLVTTDTIKKDNSENHGHQKQTCFVQPLNMIRIRKDLFQDPAPDIPAKECNCQEKLKTKKVKKQKAKAIKYRCEDCCKNFETWRKLYLHARLHKKSIECPIDKCEKKFATKGDLEKHVRTHTGEKPYRCDHCDKSFAQKGSLKSHIETVHSSKSSRYR